MKWLVIALSIAFLILALRHAQLKRDYVELSIDNDYAFQTIQRMYQEGYIAPTE